MRISREKKYVFQLALQIVERYRESYRQYELDCEADRENGYRAHYCEHGTNNWTDYDNICGPCEDGLTLRYGTWKYQLALWEAKARHAQFDRLISVGAIMDRYAIEYDRAAFRKIVKDTLDPAAYFVRN